MLYIFYDLHSIIFYLGLTSLWLAVATVSLFFIQHTNVYIIWFKLPSAWKILTLYYFLKNKNNTNSVFFID